MKATKIIALLMVTFIYRNAFSQSIFIKGFIRDARTGMALSNVSILNQTQYKKYITNLYGAFTINTQTGDSVLVTAIGYRPLSIIISAAQANDIQQWEIFQTPIKLKTFLYHYQNTDSIAELYARQIKSNSLLNDYQHIFNRPKGAPLKYMPLLIIFGGCTGCITSLWEKFAKRGKELNKFERVYALYQQQIKADEKFNLAWFKKISGLNEKECETYFRRCRPHNEFILVNNEYDIALYIKNCLQNQTIKK